MIAPARRAAFDVLLQIDSERVDLGTAMAAVQRQLADERDRGLALELVSGTLRRRAALDYQIASRTSRPLARLDRAVLASLRLAAYQVMYLSRQPASAAINDAVELVRRAGKSSAAGLANAVLRALSRDRDTLRWPPRPAAADTPEDQARLVEHLATVHSHPGWLVSRWVVRHGADAAERWLMFNNELAPLCLAPNRAVVTREQLQERLRAEGVETRRTVRAPHGLIVEAGRPLRGQAFTDGLFVAQDEASQLIAELASPPNGARVLDLCASPGGKTVALAADVGPAGLVVACDLRPHRLRVLARTLRRCRVSRAPVVQVPPAGDLPFVDTCVDAVLIDAPCSGLGTLRRDPDIRWRRTADDLPVMAGMQRALLARAARLVRPGGCITYSTCSSEPDENQDVVAAFLRDHPAFSLAREHQTLPFRDALEAFYGAVLKRNP